MIGDRLRARFASDEGDPSFLGIGHPDVAALIAEFAPGSEAVELGGWTSTNVHLVGPGQVLRVHQRFVTRSRLAAVHDARRSLLARGLLVPEPLALLRCGQRVAELETYVPHTALAGDVAQFEALGQLHRASRGIAVPRPVDAQYGTPATLRRYLLDVRGDAETMRVAQWALGIVRELRRQWVPARELPTHFVHGDLVGPNLGRSDDGRALYLDFGCAAVRPRIHDLAVALFYLVVGPNDEGLAPDFDWSRVPELLQAYESASGEQLTDLEHRALTPYAAAIPLAVAAPAAYFPDSTYLRYRERRAGMTIAEWLLAHPIK
ncbi:phosphotransferase enzyme family protein [Tenggerimyces flavus]|uniref:Phosphotransferase enzyme family protein n=1 Tax=Tenggerimyces flavus TaxID=1708749 RepID=A0ABV7YFR9_9ACTN|nr:phosphotransferase [Tenggerimyces flavus]MBM7783974.1 Ser/Thr protein kinase RdoA (MazF antagonist) [Tenggerimyces flavus]